MLVDPIDGGVAFALAELVEGLADLVEVTLEGGPVGIVIEGFVLLHELLDPGPEFRSIQLGQGVLVLLRQALLLALLPLPHFVEPLELRGEIGDRCLPGRRLLRRRSEI